MSRHQLVSYKYICGKSYLLKEAIIRTTHGYIYGENKGLCKIIFSDISKVLTIYPQIQQKNFTICFYNEAVIPQETIHQNIVSIVNTS